MFNFMGLINGTEAIQTNVSCTCNCKRSTSFQSMEISQLEFVQILVIVVVMMVMVVVITCLLNHYRLSARSFISRHNQARRRHLPLASDGSLWSSDGPGPSSGMSEQQVYTPRPPDRVPSYLQRDHLAPQQQLELNRESVRAPPNRTVYDSHLLDTSLCPPPSLNPGVSATVVATAAQAYSSRVEGAPPTYSEVIGHYYHPSSKPRLHQTPTGGPGRGGGLGGPGPSPPPSLLHGILQQAHLGSLESRSPRSNKEKQKPQPV
ncbi:hypothetical protein DPEC_G00209030 [Dallia pectoralis]|uniref:Uncharacterized protein n=1 Tax=Dallia pectoralis TaxID=75939 RepID=A0ACC2G517_DALPE|nr:hypothetical protein DPEC_G00209030 [Dallia pectoralis]